MDILLSVFFVLFGIWLIATVIWSRIIYNENESIGTSAAQDLGNWIKQKMKKLQ